jgi:hypothetical protein
VVEHLFSCLLKMPAPLKQPFSVFFYFAHRRKLAQDVTYMSDIVGHNNHKEIRWRNDEGKIIYSDLGSFAWGRSCFC